jgi:uncharacterized protein YaiI (UPF0178 family)
MVCLFAPLLPGSATASDGDVFITANVFLNPLEVQASAPSEVAVGTVFTVKAVIGNNGDLRMRKVTAVMYLPNDLELVKSKAESKRGVIAAHKDATDSWKVRAIKKGNYVIMVLGSGTYGGTVVTEQDVVLVAVR